MKEKARGTTAVGSFAPNAFGLHDSMHGNVWESCRNWYGADYYATSPKSDPPGPNTGEYRVLRGGGWGGDPQVCRAADRFRVEPVFRDSNVGFRVVLDLK